MSGSAPTSTAPSHDNPLPHAFTKDAIEHEHAVFLHVLREEGLGDDWAACFQGALGDLSQSIESRGWLDGIRRAREEEAMWGGLRGRWDVETRLADINRSISALKAKDEPSDCPKRLVLTMSSPSTFVPTVRDASGARISRYACKFEPGTWTLPRFEHKGKVLGHGGEVLVGLAEWVCGNDDEPPPVIIGGTFAVRGVKSPAIYESLCRAMRIAVYVHLAIHLELSLMRDLHVKLVYPPPASPVAPKITIPSADSTAPVTPSDSKKHGLWGLWAKTSELLHPVAHRHPSVGRRSPLRDNAPLPSLPTPNRSSLDSYPRSQIQPSNEQIHRPPRPSLDLSRVFLAGGPLSAGTGPKSALFAKPQQPPVPPKPTAPKPAPDPLGSLLDKSAPGIFAFPSSSPTSPTVRPVPGGFAALVETLKSEASVLSTSPGVIFDAPTVIVRLAEKELDPNEDPGDFIAAGTGGNTPPAGVPRRIQEDTLIPSRSQTPTPGHPHLPLRRPTGDEKAGLASVLGWKGNTGSSADMGPGPGPGIDLRNQWRANSIFGVGERGLLRSGSIFGIASETSVSGASGMTVVRSAAALRGRAKGKMGKEWKGRGMCGVAGFVRHQGLTVLYAEYVDVLGSLGAHAPTRESTGVLVDNISTTAAEVTGGEVVSEPGTMANSTNEKANGSRPSSVSGASIPIKNEASSLPPRKATTPPRHQSTTATTFTPAPKLCAQAHWRTYRYFRFGRSPWESDAGHDGDGDMSTSASKPDSNTGDEPEGDGTKRDSISSGTTTTRPKESPTGSRTVTSSSMKPGLKGKDKEKPGDGSESVLDEPLGLFVARLCKAADRDEVCPEVGCAEYVAKHRMSWIHNHVRVVLSLSEDDDWVDIGLSPVEQDDNSGIRTWITCGICGERTEKKELGPGGFLFSLAKFLELLIYSPSISRLDSPLCSHTTSSRHTIVRYFSHGGWMVAFETSEVQDVYEVKVPKVRMLRAPIRNSNTGVDLTADERVRSELRLQITRFWKCIKDYLDELDSYLKAREANPEIAHKRLPTTPPESDTETEDRPRVPRKSSGASPGLPRKASQPALARVAQLPQLTRSASMQGSPRVSSSRRHSPLRPPSTLPAPPPPPPPPPPLLPPQRKTSDLAVVTPVPPVAPPPTALPNPPENALFTASAIDRALLQSLRTQLMVRERELYDVLARAGPGALNDARRQFIVQGRGAVNRIRAWEQKHTPEAKGLREMKCVEPDWWGKDVHVIPGSDVIVREGDLGSMIAFTLSSADYATELENLRNHRIASFVESDEGSRFSKASTSSISVLPSRAATPSRSAPSTPDPDQDDPTLWGEAEKYSAVITRKEHPRDISTLLSLRDVLRHKRTPDSGPAIPSKFMSLGSSANRVVSGAPPAAWSKPAVEVSTQFADGLVSSADDEVHKLLSEHYGRALGSDSSATPTPRMIPSAMPDVATSTSVCEVDMNDESSDDDETATPAPPPKDVTPATATSTRASEQGTLTSVFATAMKYVLNPLVDKPVPVHHVGLMAIDPNAAYGPIDERPHIKYDWMVGTRLKFSCTVYFARQFDAMRRRCGVAEGFTRSLAESANWLAEGGKSKSNFFKTRDDRYIIKSLVNAWNVADLQILIEMAPSYFRYIDSTHSKASVLAKMLGFYTIEVKNLETGATQTRADVLVMENLMFGRTISQTFDLKGIKGRKVKPGNKGKGTTLFDGEWIEGASRALLLVRPHSKLILQEAVRCDAEFLAKANIMDYSLLLGVDQEHSEIACGLVDTIGSYTFAKTLENKAKSNLQSGREVTVVPPAEYQDRFVKAIERYFLACPDKWSKPSPSIPDVYDPAQLPSVL